MPFTCGSHRAFVYEQGGVNVVGELTPLTMARWHRIRDDVSTAEVAVPTTVCCDLLGDLRTITHELHIERNGEKVWEGPITRLEYEWDQVLIFAADVLWQSTRKVITAGYSHAHPNIGNAIDRMHWLMNDQCYALDGDPWNVAATHLHPHHHANDPKTSRVTAAYQFYVWEDFDKFAEDYGADYCVVNRDIHYFDNHLAWKVIDPLDEAYISQYPRIVEYGNQLATKGYVTNGKGYAGIATNPTSWGTSIDLLITNSQDGNTARDPTTGADLPPTPEEIAQWADTAARNIDGKSPSPVLVIVPANTSLLPGGPWEMADLVPGAWFQVSITRMCREVTQWQRLHEITVEESAPEGETVSFTSIEAPTTMVVP